MFNIIPPGTNIDFVGKRKTFLWISSLVVIGTIVLIFTKGLNFGIDFTGGAEIQINVPSDWDISRVRDTLGAGGLKGTRVQQIGESYKSEFLIRVQGDAESLNRVSKQVNDVFAAKLAVDQFKIQRADVVGAAAGSLLRQQGFLAMFYALLVILVYVGLRFDSRYAPGAVLALFHDSFFVLGIFILTGKQFDLTILAALLALIGYSNNDTIIVYDRVRETLQLHPDLSIEKAVNRAINETLGRTIVTSLTTFFVVSALFVWGGSVIQNFAFTLMIGVVIGTYSSMFIASNLIITITNYRKTAEDKARKNPKKKKKRVYKVRPDPSL